MQIIEQVVPAKTDMGEFMQEREQPAVWRIGGIDEDQGSILIDDGEGAKLIDAERSVGIFTDYAIHHDDDAFFAHLIAKIGEGVVCLFKPIDEQS